MSVNSLGILLNVYLCSFLRRTDHSSKLRVCANQQALHIGPVAAAGCAGAAEASAAPPSEPQPCPRSIAAHQHHLASLKGSENHSLTSALQSSGPMPPCSAPPPNPPQSVSKGSEVQHQAVTTSDGEAAAAQRKHFRVYFLFLKSELLLSPRSALMGDVFVLWHSEWKDLWYIFLEMSPRGSLGLWLLFVLFYVMKQKVDETKTTVFGSSRTTFTAELQSDANVREILSRLLMFQH